MMIAAISVEALVSGGAAMIASLTGWLAYRTNTRQKNAMAAQAAIDRQFEMHQKELDAALTEAAKTADLAKTEVNGWKTLIATLTAQYSQAAEEASKLRERLTAGNLRFEELSAELMEARKDTTEGLAIIRRLEAEVRSLRDQIQKLNERLSQGAERDMRRAEKRLGEISDEIDAGIGVPGPQGEKGDTGAAGERGEKGDHGQGGVQATD